MKMTTSVYKSWEKIQKEKFDQIAKHTDKELFSRIFHKRLILDMGCGNGYLERAYRGDFVGIDNDPEMLAKSVALFPRVMGDGDELPFKDAAFDSVVSIDTVHLIKTNDFLRVLKPGGIVLFSVFFNNENHEERKEMLRKKVSGLIVIQEFDTHTKEKEHVIIAMKKSQD
jgi:SAM-dependent methyltransferase